MKMFSSVFSSLKSQTDRFKESLNSDQMHKLSSRLKVNVVEKSSLLRDSLTQTFQPYLLNKNGKENSVNEGNSERVVRKNVSTDNSRGDKFKVQGLSDIGNGDRSCSPSSSSTSMSTWSSSSSSVPYYAQHRNSNSSYSKRGNQDDRNSYRSQKNSRSSKTTSVNGSGHPLKWPMLQNANKTWISFDAKNNPYGNRNRWGHNSVDEKDECDSSDSSDEEDENEDITGRFERITSNRSSSVNGSYNFTLMYSSIL